MRLRLLVVYGLIAMFTAFTAFTVRPAPAQAIVESSCSTHLIPITSWSIQTDVIYTDWDFKCGGANNMDYYVVLALQVKVNGVWQLENCTDNPSYCHIFKPEGAEFCPFCIGTGNHYEGGTEHTGSSNFPSSESISGKTFRIRADAQFKNGWHVYYYGISATP